MIEAAFKYMPSTIPLVGKRPIIRDWTHWPATSGTISAWWEARPDDNVGVRTGNGLAVLDVDPRDGGDVELAALERRHGPLLEAPTVCTGGNGFHFYFRCSRDQRSHTIAPGLEVKANGRQVCAPPSLHESGRVYVCVPHPGRPPLGSELPELPAWLRGDRAREQDHRGATSATTATCSGRSRRPSTSRC